MFFEVLVSLLGKHGVAIHDVNVTETGEVKIDIDFSEHDKQFKERIGFLTRKHEKLFDENQELKQRIAELESKNNQLTESILRKETKIHELESKETPELPFDPLECANYLINATYERETSSLERGLKGLPEKVNSDRYTVDDLEQIAEHLLVYCKHNKELE